MSKASFFTLRITSDFIAVTIISLLLFLTLGYLIYGPNYLEKRAISKAYSQLILPEYLIPQSSAYQPSGLDTEGKYWRYEYRVYLERDQVISNLKTFLKNNGFNTSDEITGFEGRLFFSRNEYPFMATSKEKSLKLVVTTTHYGSTGTYFERVADDDPRLKLSPQTVEVYVMRNTNE